MVRIDVEHRFGVSVHEGFDYITEPANWPAYWPRFVRLDPESRLRVPGDRARLTLRILAREVDLEMTLARLERYRVVEYTSEQRGLPAARHWRHFQEADGGFTYRIVIEYFPRAGRRGLLDRTLVRQAITRAGSWDDLVGRLLWAREPVSAYGDEAREEFPPQRTASRAARRLDTAPQTPLRWRCRKTCGRGPLLVGSGAWRIPCR